MSRDDLRALCAAFGTTSAAPMLHVAGVTPECDLEPANDAELAKISQTATPGCLEIDLCPDAISNQLETKHMIDPGELRITMPFTERRRGVEMKLIAGKGAKRIDQKLLKNVALATHWYQQLKIGRSFDEIASEAGTSKRRVQQIVELAFLAPDIVRDITKGVQPTGLTSDWCLRHAFPADWQAQRERIAAL